MTQVIIFTNENGGVSVTTPTPEFLETHTIEDVLAKDCPVGSLIVDQDDLPNADSDFFNSWELVDGTIVVNTAKAKEQTKDRLRTEREPLLAAQDVLYMRATEANQDTTAIVAEKQRLRDLPTLADACTTLNALRALKA
jgi:hypothetical protein